MIAPSNKAAPQKPNSSNFLLIVAIICGIAVVAFIAYLCMSSNKAVTDETPNKPGRKIATVNQKPHRSNTNTTVVPTTEDNGTQVPVVDEPKTNQWGNPAHWGHKKLRPAMVHKIDRAQMPLFEQVFLNRADRTIAGLLVIEPGTDLIGDEVFDESFVKAFLKSIQIPIIISKDDDEETRALKRAVIDTKIDLKARLDAGEDIAKTLTDIRRELRELGAYREELKQLIAGKSRDHSMSVDDMKDFVQAANIMLDERGAKPIVMPEFYYRQLEIRNQKIKAHKGER